MPTFIIQTDTYAAYAVAIATVRANIATNCQTYWEDVIPYCPDTQPAAYSQVFWPLCLAAASGEIPASLRDGRWVFNHRPQ